MPNLFVYQPKMGAFTLSVLEMQEQMPLVRRFFFPAAEFISGAHSAIAWTDARALAALDALAAQYPAPFKVTCAFRRWPDARRNRGLCFSLSAACPASLRACALESGLFSAVSPPFCGGRDISVCVSVPEDGDAGVHIFALQDALLACGCFHGPLSGTLCAQTRYAQMRIAPNAPVWGLGAGQ